MLRLAERNEADKPAKAHKTIFAPNNTQGDFESCADILITSYWLHVELGKNI
jgi:hypothetical protein